MTRDEIITMAREASQQDGTTPQEKSIDLYAAKSARFLERFAELVAAAAKAEERASCAAVCDGTLAKHYMQQTIPARDESLLLAACADCAAAIRARGEV